MNADLGDLVTTSGYVALFALLAAFWLPPLHSPVGPPSESVLVSEALALASAAAVPPDPLALYVDSTVAGVSAFLVAALLKARWRTIGLVACVGWAMANLALIASTPPR